MKFSIIKAAFLGIIASLGMHTLYTMNNDYNTLIVLGNNLPVIKVVIGDITKQKVDVIVNAANSKLSHGGGVAAAISKAAGPELQEECDIIAAQGTIAVGHAVNSASFGLEKQGIKRIIHAVGPMGTDPNRETLLTQAYQNSLHQHNIGNDPKITSIAFPAISINIFGYDVKDATPVAIKAVLGYLAHHKLPHLKEIRFVLYDTDPEKAKAIKKLYVDTLAPYAGKDIRQLGLPNLLDNNHNPLPYNAQAQNKPKELQPNVQKPTQQQPAQSAFHWLKSPYFLVPTLLLGAATLITGLYLLIKNRTKSDKKSSNNHPIVNN